MTPVLQYITAHEPRFISELIQLSSFPSVSAQTRHRGDVKACATWLLNHCTALGLKARLVTTPGNPVLVASTPRFSRSAKPHFVVYGHYDVQPAEPFELWKTKPFEPTIKGRSLFGRGTSDNKGQHFAHLKAVEAYFRTGTPLPCDLTFVIEGEEEIGSSHLAAFLKEHRAELRCDAIVISDTSMPALKLPALTYSLRGITELEIKVHGPSCDLHSGIHGGTVDNPAMALCQLLGSLRDTRGRVAIPGFYNDVKALSKLERRQAARFPLQESSYRKFLGVPKLFGEKGFTPQEQRSARPTLEINGLTGGYQGEGSKTIVPSWASAKLSLRLVPDQHPEKILALVTRHFKKLCPPSVRLEITEGACGRPYFVSPESQHTLAAQRALKASFHHDPILIREGGSIPIVNDFKRILGVDTLLLGLALPDDNAHSPNEKISLDAFTGGIRMSAHLWRELARKT